MRKAGAYLDRISLLKTTALLQNLVPAFNQSTGVIRSLKDLAQASMCYQVSFSTLERWCCIRLRGKFGTFVLLLLSVLYRSHLFQDTSERLVGFATKSEAIAHAQAKYNVSVTAVWSMVEFVESTLSQPLIEYKLIPHFQLRTKMAQVYLQVLFVAKSNEFHV